MISEIRQDEVRLMMHLATEQRMRPSAWRNSMWEITEQELERFAEIVRFNVSEARLNHCIELLEKRGHKDAADLLRGEG